MTANDRSAQLRRDLRAIVGDGVAFSVMVGAGESYIPAFALAAGLGEITAGLVATLPMLVGAAFQLVTPGGGAPARLAAALGRAVRERAGRELRAARDRRAQPAASRARCCSSRPPSTGASAWRRGRPGTPG